MKTELGFLTKIVGIANANQALMDGTTRPVLDLIAENEIVFGIWQDHSLAHNVGHQIIKGAQKIREISANGIPAAHSITAIPCICAEQAEALRQVFGDQAEDLH